MLIEVRHLHKWFDLGRGQRLHAVDDVSLRIGERRIVGLVGESGSGKSTFGKTLLGLHPKSGGEVWYRGERLPDRYRPQDFLRLGREMQMIFQDPYASLNPRMTVEEILTEPLRLLSLSRAHSRQSRRQLAASWLDRVNLGNGCLQRYPHEFSGGQRQRIGIARALIAEPRFVVCDEPISALDVSVQAQVVNLLAELQTSMGLTLLFIAHDLTMVRYISDEMVVMYLGSIVEQGPTASVFASPRHPYTQALIAANPEADPAREKQRRHETITGEIPSPLNRPRGCHFVSRCPHASERCRLERPRLQPVADGEPGTAYRVACHLYD